MSEDVCPTPRGEPITPEEHHAQVIETAVFGLWEVVNQLSSLPQPKRSRYSVSIFGSARLSRDSWIYAGVRSLASELTRLNCDIITGGGPGLMAAANEGSVEADPNNCTDSIGIRIDLDFEQHANPFVEQLYHHRTFFSRLHHFVLRSDAFVVVPGGIGTTLETLMIWQLLQVQQLRDRPLILIGPMWADLVTWARESMLDKKFPLASPEDIQIPHCVDTFDEAIAKLRHAHQAWQGKL
ncbi:LOG family protein [Lyngbya confervoides]|uniref:LOG family protein n=1 Tax=Lyngbya confervoides BDU141951 TaxID=1574623 RepID=A0ABD4T1W6_9CYAN|nr:LOG family protein [Lyngbya confervoides]MCM1982493.1 LOG family protein [Lyngbya confervoides BDU141951]